MRILFKAIAWTAVTLGAASAGTSDTKEKIVPTAEIKTALPKSIASMPPIYLTQLKTDEKLPPKKAEEKYKFIKNKHIEMAMQDRNSILFNVIVSHPEFDSKDLEKLARNNKQEEWTEFVAMYVPAERVRPEDLEAGNPDLPFYRGIKKNISFLLTQKDSTKESIQKAKEERARILKEVWEKRPTDTDFFFAEDHPNSPFAGILAASKNNYVLNVPFGRSVHGTVYGRNTLLNEKAEISLKTIRIFLEKANTPEAGIAASRLTEEQMTKEIIELVRGKLRDTEFGRGAASSKHFPVTNDDIDYMLYNPDKKFSEGLASVIEVTDWVKTFPFNNKKFSESNTSRYLAKNPNYRKNGSNIAAVEDFILKGDNYKSPFSLGVVESSDYIASPLMKVALRALAQKNPEAEILYLATKNPNYSKGIEKQELEFALKTPGKYTEGLMQGLPCDYIDELIQEALKNPHRSDLATVLHRSDVYPDKELFRSAKDSLTLTQALSRNPHVGAFAEAN